MNACFESWPAGEVRALPLEEIGERYRRYRLSSPEAEEEMGALSDGLSRMENWLRHRGRADLTACDTSLLRPAFEKLGAQCRLVAELAEDLVGALAD